MKKKIFKNINFKKSTIIKLLTLTILICIIITLVVLYKNNDNVRKMFDKYVFMKHVQENNLPKIETDSKYIYAFKNNILVFKDNELKAYNKNEKEEYSLHLEISNPIFKVNGDYFCIAENGGKRIYVIANKNIIWQSEVNGNISDVSINKNGQVAITTLGTTDKSVVTVYNAKGEEQFSKHIADDLVLDVALSEDNKNLAIAKVNYSGINVKCTIETIDIKEAREGKTVINEYKSELGDLIINIHYTNKNALVCMYDKYIAIIKDNTITKKVDFSLEEVLFADINDKIIQVGKTKENTQNSKIEIKMLNIETDKVKQLEIEEPKAIYVFGDIIAVNFGSEAIFINNNGWLIKEYTSSQEIKNIVISENIAGIIYKHKVEIISL